MVGFLEGLDHCVPALRLLRLNGSSASGAAFLAARKQGVTIPLDYSRSTEDFYHFDGATCEVEASRQLEWEKARQLAANSAAGDMLC